MSTENTEDSKATIEDWIAQVENLGPYADLISLNKVMQGCPDKDHVKFHWLDGFAMGIEREMMVAEDKAATARNDEFIDPAATDSDTDSDMSLAA